jgi:hypothetical protein
MLNEKVLSVFDVIMTYLSGDEYVVIAKNEMRALLPPDMTQQEIDSAITSLQTNELIAIRYVDTEVYCIAVMPKGILESEKRRDEKAAMKAVADSLSAAAAREKEENKEDDGKTDSVKNEIAPPNAAAGGVKTAFLCGLCAFLGAFFGALVALAVMASKLG